MIDTSVRVVVIREREDGDDGGLIDGEVDRWDGAGVRKWVGRCADNILAGNEITFRRLTRMWASPRKCLGNDRIAIEMIGSLAY